MKTTERFVAQQLHHIMMENGICRAHNSAKTAQETATSLNINV